MLETRDIQSHSCVPGTTVMKSHDITFEN